MRGRCASLQPDQFADITAVSALYPPGPMGGGLVQQVRPPQERPRGDRADPPALAEALEPVLGRPTARDRLPGAGDGDAQVLAGFTLGAADNLRRAMGKKKKGGASTSSTPDSRPACARARLPPGGDRHAVEILLPFSDYAFNKSHSAAYGVITYWTAYLKGPTTRRAWRPS